jgi:hypothetical protein
MSEPERTPHQRPTNRSASHRRAAASASEPCFEIPGRRSLQAPHRHRAAVPVRTRGAGVPALGCAIFTLERSAGTRASPSVLPAPIIKG